MEKKNEFKGLYIQDKDQSVAYYEYGAHFSYKALYNRLELILKNNNKNIKIFDKKILLNLKKANSQKILFNKNNQEQNLNISRNIKIYRNKICDKLINNDKWYKSKSINKRMELSKSFNEDLFGSFSLKIKYSTKNQNCKNKNYKAKKKKEMLLKKNSQKKEKHKIILLNNNNNKYKLKNKHTVLKYVVLPKKEMLDKNINENYYGFSFINNNDSDICSNSKDTSFNSTGNNNHNYSNYYNKNNLNNNNFYSSKYKKVKISSIINKKFIQNLINDSPKSNSSSFLRNNTSGYYYKKNQNHRISDNNILTSSIKNKHNNSDIEFENKNDCNNNYYIENDNCKNYQGAYNSFINKNILLNKNKPKNKKMTIFNNFNKINFQKNIKVNYLNSFNNPLLLCEKIKLINSNKNSAIKSNPKFPSNLFHDITKENFLKKSNSNSLVNNCKTSNKTINKYNCTSNNKKISSKKYFLKNHLSNNNILNIKKTNKNTIKLSHNNNKNIDTFSFYIEGENSCSRNKKSRNNNAKNIVNLLCCHFSINFNSPIDLLNNFENNIYNNDFNNKTPKIQRSNFFDINNNGNDRNNDIKKNEDMIINNIVKSRNNKTNIITNNKNIEEVGLKKIKNNNSKKTKIPIDNKEKYKIIRKNIISKSNYKLINKKETNNLNKKKFTNNISKEKHSLTKKRSENIINSKKNNKKFNKKYSGVIIKVSNNSSNNYSMNNISTSSNLNNN